MKATGSSDSHMSLWIVAMTLAHNPTLPTCWTLSTCWAMPWLQEYDTVLVARCAFERKQQMKTDTEVIGILYLYIILFLGAVMASVNFLLALVSNVWAFSSSQCQDQCFPRLLKPQIDGSIWEEARLAHYLFHVYTTLTSMYSLCSHRNTKNIKILLLTSEKLPWRFTEYAV